MGRRGKPSNLTPEERRGIQSIDNGMSVLNAVASFQEPVSLTELSDTANMPASKVYRYLTSLIRGGMVVQDTATGRYDLGPQLLRLGLAAMSRLDIVENAVQQMTRLTAESRIMSILSVWGEHGPTVIRIKKGSEQIFTSLTLGSTLSPILSATGLAFLAHLPDMPDHDSVAEALHNATLHPNHGPKSKVELSKTLDDVRSRGFARSFSLSGTAQSQVSAAAVPVLDAQNEAAAVITLMSRRLDLSDAENPAIQQLIETGRSASTVLAVPAV